MKNKATNDLRFERPVPHKTLVTGATLTDGKVLWTNINLEENPSVFQQLWTIKMSGEVQPSASRSYVLTYDLPEVQYPYQLSFDSPLQGFLNLQRKTAYNAFREVSFTYDNTLRQLQFVIKVPCDVRIVKATPIFLDVFLYNNVEPVPVSIFIRDVVQDQSSSDCTGENSVIYDYINYQNGTSLIRISPCSESSFLTPIQVDIGGEVPTGHLLQVQLKFPNQENTSNTLIVSSQNSSSVFPNLSFVDFVFFLGREPIFVGYVFQWNGSAWEATDGTQVLINNLWNDPIETFVSTRCVSTNSFNTFLRDFTYLVVDYEGVCSSEPPSQITIYCSTIPENQLLAFVPYISLTNIHLRIQNNDGSTFTEFFYTDLTNKEFFFDGSVWQPLDQPSDITV